MNAEPPAKVDIKRVRRSVLAEKPRVTRFAIKWYVQFTIPIVNIRSAHDQVLIYMQGYRGLRSRRISS